MSYALPMIQVVYNNEYNNIEEVREFVEMQEEDAWVERDEDEYLRLVVRGKNLDRGVWNGEYLLYDYVEEIFLTAELYKHVFINK